MRIVLKAAGSLALLLVLPAFASAVEVDFGNHLQKVKISGDLRLRQEISTKKTEGQTDRQRQRFRLRLGTDFVFPSHLTARVRFASGSGETTGTNQSFDDTSSQKGLWIDRAYLQWEPAPLLRLAGGRMENPLWRNYASEIVWDEDVNPEGFAQTVQLGHGGHRYFLTALQMAVDEDSQDNNDQWLLSEQAGAQWALPAEGVLKAAVAYHEWVNERTGTFGQVAVQEGNRRDAAGVLMNDFGVLDLTGELNLRFGPSLPVSLQGSVIRNMQARTDLSSKENTGFQSGLILGRAADKGTAEMAYFYRYLETDATPADLTDSDFGDGGTNRKGHLFWFAYNPDSWVQLKAKYSITRVVDAAFPPLQDNIDRFQFDINVKF